ncbi:putative Ulp1 protease family catalytic domain, Transposase-associated domain-containing protein [Rosa chinensis]|uniref:Putative Ulp1 protease family catalytic domain, Transposase-associated domain-containing protein n=1 Tax=Rosa chinensis TaxID=74649 RepID=A0A2P6PKM3_ROSCH|nr:uncharacterized protein LOC112172280 [Rosa chinensis]PRQ22472.1 putative Ulp1 protease family catalytic domain, Transposase-associated domain-containing protein [Rosa chinensis]
MDKSWINADRDTLKYELGVENFLIFAEEYASNPKRIRCPCARCVNFKKKSIKVIRGHLYDYGFSLGYTAYRSLRNAKDWPMSDSSIHGISNYMNLLLKETSWILLALLILLLRTYNCERSDFSSYLVNLLKEGKADRIFFMPYNPEEHWILTIIWEDEIYILDPLGKSIHYQAWESSVINAIKSFNAETGRANKVPKLKLLPGVPKQLGGIECGYCVMRYMKDVINDEQLSFPTKWAARTRKVYTQEELDEVRIEVADYLQTLL